MAGWTRVSGVVLSAISATANGILRVFRVQPTSELRGTYTAEDLGHEGVAASRRSIGGKHAWVSLDIGIAYVPVEPTAK